MNKAEAIDFIDAYGTEEKRWPAGVSAKIKRLIANDNEFKAHFEEQKALDAALAAWEEDDDGVEIDKDEMSDADGETDDSDYHSSGEAGPQGKEPDEREVKWDFTEADIEELEDVDDILAKEIDAKVSSAVGDKYYTFSTQYDEVFTIEPEAYALDHYGNRKPISTETLDKKVREATGVLQKNLHRLIVARSRAINTPGFRSGKLHGASLHRITTGDDRLFRRKQEAKTIDTAISFVVDCSGSMNADIGGGARRIDLAIESAYALAQVCGKIGIDFEVIGFTNTSALNETKLGKEVVKEFYEEVEKVVESGITVHRYYPLVFPVFKNFGETFNPQIAKRFAYAQVTASKTLRMQANTDGESIRYAARRLAARDVERRIMIVLSDGQPAAYDAWWGKGQRPNPHFLEDDLKLAVKEISQSGIEVLGIGMAYPDVRDYYPNCEVINNVSALPKALMGQLSKMLLGR